MTSRKRGYKQKLITYLLDRLEVATFVLYDSHYQLYRTVELTWNNNRNKLLLHTRVYAYPSSAVPHLNVTNYDSQLN